jgi:hypothetical protein
VKNNEKKDEAFSVYQIQKKKDIRLSNAVAERHIPTKSNLALQKL